MVGARGRLGRAATSQCCDNAVMRVAGRGMRIAVLVATCAGAFALALPAVGARGVSEPAVIPTIDDRGMNETRATVPISRTRGALPYVVLSERLNTQGGLRRGDIIRATAEVQLSTTCARPEPRCIGSRYDYSPRMDGRIVLAASPTATGGAKADPISKQKTRRCNQRRPNRNHHCVLVFSDGLKKVRNLGNLPCKPDRCYINVIASADHPRAAAGNVVVVGADRPNGTVEGDKGRVDGIVVRGEVPAAERIKGGAKLRNAVPIAPSGAKGRKVVRSLRIDGLQKGDALQISSHQKNGISHLPYNVFIGTRVIVATSPTETRTNGFVARVVSSGGEITEQNGFNCTHGGSAYQDPCGSPKAATAYIKRKMPQKNGGPKPAFINIVQAALPKLANAAPNDKLLVGDGRIRVDRFRAPKAR